MEVSCRQADGNVAQRLFAERVWRWTPEDLDRSWRTVFQLLNFQQADISKVMIYFEKVFPVWKMNFYPVVL